MTINAETRHSTDDEDAFEEVSFSDVRPPYKESAALHGDLEARWGEPDAVAKTGMRGLDAMLNGGLRRGECVALGGSAGKGKSSLAIQLAVEAARSGGTVIYCTADLAPEEILARAVAREMFSLADQAGGAQAVSFGEVLRGHHQTGRGAGKETAETEVQERYLRAREQLLREAFPRFIIHPLAAGATVTEVADRVAAVRAWRSFDGLVVLVIDPLERLFASASGARTGRTLESINADERARASAVASELKALSNAQNLAAVFTFTSDTDEVEDSGDPEGNGLVLGGSSPIETSATVVLTVRTGRNDQHLARRTEGLTRSLDEYTVSRSVPGWWGGRRDAAGLGAHRVLLRCAKNRNGQAASFVMGFIAGAGAFVERDPSAE